MQSEEMAMQIYWFYWPAATPTVSTAIAAKKINDSFFITLLKLDYFRPS